MEPELVNSTIRMSRSLPSVRTFRTSQEVFGRELVCDAGQVLVSCDKSSCMMDNRVVQIDEFPL